MRKNGLCARLSAAGLRGLNSPTQMRPSRPRIKLSGFAPAATILVDLLGSSHQFDMVRLVSAQSAGLGSGLDRLQLSARLASRASATTAAAHDARGQP